MRVESQIEVCEKILNIDSFNQFANFMLGDIYCCKLDSIDKATHFWMWTMNHCGPMRSYSRCYIYSSLARFHTKVWNYIEADRLFELAMQSAVEERDFWCIYKMHEKLVKEKYVWEGRKKFHYEQMIRCADATELQLKTKDFRRLIKALMIVYTEEREALCKHTYWNPENADAFVHWSMITKTLQVFLDRKNNNDIKRKLEEFANKKKDLIREYNVFFPIPVVNTICLFLYNM